MRCIAFKTLVLGLTLWSWTASVNNVCAQTPVVITNQPQNQTTPATGKTTFTVGVSGSPVLYQWFKGAGAIASATNSSHIILNTQPVDAGTYRVLASNTISSATSSNATLTVTPDTLGPRLVSATASETTNQITVLFNEPLFPSASNVTFYTITPPGSMTSLVVSNAIRSANSVILTVSPWIVGTNYLLTVNKVRDNTPNTNIIAPNSQIYVTFFAQLFPMSQGWTFDQNGVEPPGNWRTNTFIDSNWGSGAGVLFHDPEIVAGWPACGGPEGADLSLGYTTSYFRTHFTSPTNGNATLKFVELIDDGAIYYLNGIEVRRIRMPSGAVTYNTLASSEVFNASCATFQTNVTNLRSGDNVLAAEVHQRIAGVGETDITFGLALSSGVTPILPAGPSPTLNMLRQGSNLIFSWTGNGFALESSSAVTGPWFEVANMSNPFTNSISGSGAASFYRLKK